MSSVGQNRTPSGPTPPLLRLVEKPGRGRSLIAACVIKPGQIVLAESPLVIYPSSLSTLFAFCSHCFRILPSKPLLCSSCCLALFCCDRCLSLSHPHLLCHALRSLLSGAATWPDDIIFLLSAYSLPSDKLLQLLSLYSNSQLPAESSEIFQSELSVLIPSNLVPTHFSLEITSSLISKEKMNSFSLMCPVGSEFKGCGVAGTHAYGLYPWASMFNHDCLPNVIGFDYLEDPNRENNTEFSFRALHEIQEGTEVCISYIGLTKGYRDRQRRLENDYGFECKCVRCTIESKWKNREEEEVEEEENEEDGTDDGEGEVEDPKGEDDDDFFPHCNFFAKYLCDDCNGCFAPRPPSDDGAVSDLMECNGCGLVKQEEPGW